MKKVFVIDDSAVMLMSVKETLSIAGFSVDTAGNGEEAIEKR